ncbi:MAG: DUF1566 domain-containing protein [Bacteroidetes bacterium]|nr:DUF1566 domain-containing protein [Bacteroidota bacterium]
MFSDRTGFNVTYLTQAERDAITNPRMSSLIFNTTDSCLQIFLGYWESIWCTPMGCVYPAILTQPVNDTAVGVPAIFTVSASGSKIYYKWQESSDGGSTWAMLSNGGTNPNYSGCYTDNLIIGNIPENYNGYQYRCYVSNACGNEISSPAILMNCYPPSIQSQPVNDTAVGVPAMFTVSATGVPLYYEWQESNDGGSTWNTILDGGTNPIYAGTNTDTLIIDNIPNYYHKYQYRCNVSNLCDNELSSPVKLFCYYGGVVFYDDGTNAYVSATSDQSSGAQWGCFGTLISGADGTAIGTGNQNTIDIEAGCTTAGIAADICANLILNGFDDWFLPSKNELNQMYINKSSIGGFSTGSYWSSTETNAESAWRQIFGSGSQGYNDKNDDRGVRCVRKD